MVIRLWWIVGIAILCTSCTHKKVSQQQKTVLGDVSELKAKRKIFNEHEVVCQEAALVDIPIPLYTQRLPVISDDLHGSQVMLGYYSSINADALISLYQEQMESYGWQLARSFVGTETLLHFEKPTKYCSVSIRPRVNFFGHITGSDLIIYLEDNRFSW